MLRTTIIAGALLALFAGAALAQVKPAGITKAEAEAAAQAAPVPPGAMGVDTQSVAQMTSQRVANTLGNMEMQLLNSQSTIEALNQKLLADQQQITVMQAQILAAKPATPTPAPATPAAPATPPAATPAAP